MTLNIALAGFRRSSRPPAKPPFKSIYRWSTLAPDRSRPRAIRVYSWATCQHENISFFDPQVACSSLGTLPRTWPATLCFTTIQQEIPEVRMPMFLQDEIRYPYRYVFKLSCLFLVCCCGLIPSNPLQYKTRVSTSLAWVPSLNTQTYWCTVNMPISVQLPGVARRHPHECINLRKVKLALLSNVLGWKTRGFFHKITRHAAAGSAFLPVRISLERKAVGPSLTAGFPIITFMLFGPRLAYVWYLGRVLHP